MKNTKIQYQNFHGTCGYTAYFENNWIYCFLIPKILKFFLIFILYKFIKRNKEQIKGTN